MTILLRLLLGLTMLSLPTMLSAHAPFADTLSTRLKEEAIRNLKKKHYSRAGQFLKGSVDFGLSLRKVADLARKYDSKPLLEAVHSTKSLLKMNGHLGISKGEYLQTALFIKTELPRQLAKKHYYLSREKTGLGSSIQYDPISHRKFICPLTKQSYIGRGRSKTVRKSILYRDHRPEVVARGEQSVNMDKELEITKLMQGAPGIFDVKGYGRRGHDGITKTAIFTKVYSPGSLQTTFENAVPLSLYEKMKAALNILKGLESLHSNEIVHRDLGARNYLINIPKGKPGKRNVDAVIADLGRAIYAKDAAYTKVQGNTTYTAPEALYRKKMKSDDYYASDVYAVGCVFYWLYYGKQGVWQDRSYVKDVKGSLRSRYKKLSRRINGAVESRRNVLSGMKSADTSTPELDFEFLILSMLSIDPESRGTATQLREKMQLIFDGYS